MYELLSEGKSRIRLRCTHRGEIRIYSESLLLRSAFARLVQGHLKALNHLSFSLLLNFHEFSIISRHQIVLVYTRFSTFATLVQLRLFSTSKLWKVWRKASAQSSVTSRCSSTSLLHCVCWGRNLP